MIAGKKRAAVAALVIFLGFMAICTLAAKGIYTSGLPQVTLTRPERKNINHEVRASGTIRQGQELGIYVGSGLRVATVLVHKGDSFREGEPLFRIDTEDLKALIEKSELDIGKQKLQQKEAKANDKLVDKKNAIGTIRAQEDYKQAERDADVVVARKRLLLDKANKVLEDYKKSLSSAPDTVSPGDAPGGSAADAAERQRELEKAVTEANQEVEDALLAKEDAMRAANRKIEDARLAEEGVYSSAQDMVRLDLQYQEKQLERTRELLEQDGWVYAAESGYVTGQKLTVGERTADGASLVYCVGSGDRILEAVLTKEQAQFLQQGDVVAVSYNNASGKKENTQGAVTYMEAREDGSATVQIPMVPAEGTEGAQMNVGQSAEIQFIRQSDVYELCIPVSAVYTAQTGGRYVYITEEQPGILGTEWHVRQMPVTVLDSNDSYAAIQAAGFSAETEVILTHSKVIEENKVVRIVK